MDAIPGMLEAGEFVGEMGFGVLMPGVMPEDTPMFPVWLEGGEGAGGAGSGAEGEAGGKLAGDREPLMVSEAASGLVVQAVLLFNS